MTCLHGAQAFCIGQDALWQQESRTWKFFVNSCVYSTWSVPCSHAPVRSHMHVDLIASKLYASMPRACASKEHLFSCMCSHKTKQAVGLPRPQVLACTRIAHQLIPSAVSAGSPTYSQFDLRVL